MTSRAEAPRPEVDLLAGIGDHRRVSRPLIMLPGVASDAASWEAMPTGTVLCSEAATIEAMAAEILERCPARFALAGHSMGGYVALAMVRQAPARVDRLALISTSAALDDAPQRLARSAVIQAAEVDYGSVVDQLVQAMLSPTSRASTDLVGAMTAMLHRVGAGAFARHQRACLDRPDGQSALVTFAVPTLVVTGLDDRIVKPVRSGELAAAIPGARLVELAGCGHIPMRERPAEVAAELRRWLAAA